jgi:hypothetical protein
MRNLTRRNLGLSLPLHFPLCLLRSELKLSSFEVRPLHSRIETSKHFILRMTTGGHPDPRFHGRNAEILHAVANHGAKQPWYKNTEGLKLNVMLST